ncbi:PREDICTED: zinc finger protein 382-like [Galeopterus variegatus]|uniref:Zinc finger protein 382-like n=1 Tax=Galeopterus variegatus TaxID=482537 RepID=A0ABM0R979_GALVR|nr:PREDICTED: zinc finger protein 382-like [Galeopterus variegatus]
MGLQHCAHLFLASLQPQGMWKQSQMGRRAGEGELHQKTHTREKPYACNECEFFFQKWELTMHQRIHTGRKSHKSLGSRRLRPLPPRSGLGDPPEASALPGSKERLERPLTPTLARQRPHPGSRLPQRGEAEGTVAGRPGVGL